MFAHRLNKFFRQIFFGLANDSIELIAAKNYKPAIFCQCLNRDYIELDSENLTSRELELLAKEIYGEK